jgi:hypothetical protein
MNYKKLVLGFIMVFVLSGISYALPFGKTKFVENGYQIKYSKKATLKPIKIVKDKEKEDYFIVVFNTKEDINIGLYQLINKVKSFLLFDMGKGWEIKPVKYEDKGAIRIKNFEKKYRLEIILNGDEFHITVAKKK